VPRSERQIGRHRITVEVEGISDVELAVWIGPVWRREEETLRGMDERLVVQYLQHCLGFISRDTRVTGMLIKVVQS
jgi:hypothetical protein